MKTATIRQVQHNLSEVLAWVEAGEEVQVFRRNKLVARLVPAVPGDAVTPDFVARASLVWGPSPDGTPLSKILDEDRGDR